MSFGVRRNEFSTQPLQVKGSRDAFTCKGAGATGIKLIFRNGNRNHRQDCASKHFDHNAVSMRVFGWIRLCNRMAVKVNGCYSISVIKFVSDWAAMVPRDAYHSHGSIKTRNESCLSITLEPSSLPHRRLVSQSNSIDLSS
jgi:hypothetical protein